MTGEMSQGYGSSLDLMNLRQRSTPHRHMIAIYCFKSDGVPGTLRDLGGRRKYIIMRFSFPPPHSLNWRTHAIYLPLLLQRSENCHTRKEQQIKRTGTCYHH